METMKLVFFEQMSAIGAKNIHHGDCVLILFPGGETLFIDAGQAGVGGHLARQIRALGIRHIDELLITHLHGDHTAGLPEMMEEIAIKKVLFTGVGEDWRYTDQSGLAAIREHGVPIERIVKGQAIGHSGAVMQVLSPDADVQPAPADAPPIEHGLRLNRFSTVTRLSYGHFSILLAADIGQDEEAELAAEYGSALASTVYKIPHHGHVGSCSDGILEIVRPRLALHMGKDMDAPVMRAFTSRCIPVYSTALDGCITMETDGEMLSITCEKGQRTISL